MQRVTWYRLSKDSFQRAQAQREIRRVFLGQKVPRRKEALDAWQAARDQAPDTLPPAAFLGAFLEAYQARYHRSYPDPLVEAWGALREVRAKNSAAITLKAVQMLFSAQALRWISKRHTDFLKDEDKFNRFVYPLVVDSLPSRRFGEQAEWGGKRTETSWARVTI